MVTCICDWCGKEFLRYPSDMKKGKQYCTKACYTASSRVQRTCATCGEEFSVPRSKVREGKGVYCSQGCKGSSRVVECKKCGKRFRLATSSILKRGNYCSRSCHYTSHGREPYRVMDGVVAIPLTRGKVALIDEKDIHLVEGRSWCSWRHRNTTYARSGSDYLHAVIMNTPKDMVTDHINGNGLDNRRGNLRVATHQENMNNTWYQRTRKKRINSNAGC